jgi:alpha/beta superfamily hydrolase
MPEAWGEIADARAAWEWLRSRYPRMPYTLAGFSFGARAIVNLGCHLPEAVRLVAMGFPAKLEPVGALTHCSWPKIFIQSTQDEFGPVREMEAFYAQVAEPKQLIWIEAEDHFFAGGLDQLEIAVTSAATHS